MKKSALLIVPLVILACGGETPSEGSNTTQVSTDSVVASKDTVVDKEVNRKSPRMHKTGAVYGMTVDLDYGSPRVRERTIWGDLVPYDQVWRAGADEVSSISFSQSAFFGGQELDAGTYGMFIIPRKNDKWTFILNEEWSHEEHGVWGAFDYKKEKDILRLEIEPEWIEESQEEMSFDVSKDGDLIFSWEKARFSISIGPVKPKG